MDKRGNCPKGLWSSCWFCAAMLLVALSQASAQILPFKTFTTRDGILSNYALSLCTDARGYLWIGTNDGLSRYDGISFRNYTVADGLPFSRVNCVYESPRNPGTLWIGTNGGGACKLVGRRFTSYRVGTDSWSNAVSKITEDHTGRIWATTANGIFFLDDSVFVQLPFETVPHEYSCVIELPDSSLWIVVDRHIYSYSHKTGSIREVPFPLGKGTIFDLAYVDRERNVWVATSDGQVSRVENERIVQSIRTGKSPCTFITQGDSVTLWLGVNGGIAKLDHPTQPGRQLTYYTTRNGLNDDEIMDGLVDREGDLWLANYASGLSRLVDQSVVTYAIRPPDYPPNNSTAVSDHAGHVWVCSEGSLWEYWNEAGRGWKSVRHTELSTGKNRFMPHSISLDDESNFWIVSTDNKIFEYRVERPAGKTSRLVQRNRLLPGVHFPKGEPMFVVRDDNGLLWCSMTKNMGVFLLDPRKRKPFLRAFTTHDGMPDESVRAIYQDKKGNLWFGGFSDGLSELPSDEPLDGRFRHFTTAQGLPNMSIRSILEDANGTLWVGTRYGGLAYLQDSVFHTISVNEGLLSTAVWCMARRSQGDLWVGTQLGMQSLTPLSFAFSTKKELGGDPVFSCGQTPDGMLWMISTAGLTFYDPKRDYRNVVPPPVSLSRFEVNGVEHPAAGSFELSSNEDHCFIEVAGISLRDGDGLRYQYRLLGANDEWRPPSKVRTFVFASLAPGNYTFQVRAINADGVVSAQPAGLQFRILPPIWRQWWFIAGTVLCIVLMVALLVRVRLTRLLAIERLRSRIATDLHDDIGSGLTRITILSDVAHRQVQSLREESRPQADDAGEILKELEKVRSTARGLIDTMSDVVWSIDPSHESFERLVQRLRSFAYELCEGKNIRLSFLVPEKVLSVRMSSEGMRNVLLLSKEAMTNIAKHASCSSAELKIDVEHHNLIVSVADDGKGFNPAKTEGGNGLVNMRKRTEQAGGTFAVSSGAGKGTRIVATFPLNG